MDCKVLKSNSCVVTYAYKNGVHSGIDLVKSGYQLDDIVAHSDGVVYKVVNNINYNTSQSGQRIYGNYVAIKHNNGMYTLYAHMKYGSVSVKVGDKVSKGQVIGYMGNTGYSFGGHLHFEVRDKNYVVIDPTQYVNSNLPEEKVESSATHKVGDSVLINGVYTTANSDKKLVPAVKQGTITKILNGAKNPYLLNNGNIGWINDGCIVGNTTSQSTVGQYRTLANRTTLYANSSMKGTYYTYLPKTKVQILKNVSDSVDYIYIPATGRYAYCYKSSYK